MYDDIDLDDVMQKLEDLVEGKLHSRRSALAAIEIYYGRDPMLLPEWRRPHEYQYGWREVENP